MLTRRTLEEKQQSEPEEAKEDQAQETMNKNIGSEEEKK